jgi:hypothetical protein
MLRFQRHVYPTLMVLILALSGLPQGCSMASSSKLCLFSEVQGIVLKSGQPVVNAQVKRYYTWAWKNDQRYQDETTTDAEGRFRFPAALESSFWGSWLPHEPQILQRIDIHVGEQCIPGVVARKAELPNPGGRSTDRRSSSGAIWTTNRPRTKDGYFGLAALVPSLPDTDTPSKSP